MSLVLTSSGEKLEITAGVVIPFTVHYADYVEAIPVFTPAPAAGDTINGTKDLLAAPASGQRVARTISVHNDSGGSDTVTIQMDDGGTNYTIISVTLANGYTLYYDEDGWKVLDGSGALLTVLPTHALLGPHHSDTATDAVTRGSLIVGNATPAWDELVYPGTARHLQTDATDVTWSQNITMADDAWIGIGAALERIVFDAAGDIAVMGAKFGIGTLTPSYDVDIVDAADYTQTGLRTFSTTLAHAPQIFFFKSHNDTAGTTTETIDGDVIGDMRWLGVNNAAGSRRGAQITVTQKGAAGAYVEADMVFKTYSTTAANANQLYLDGGTGYVGVGTAAPGQILDCNSGAGNMIADGYDSHPSWLSLKVDPQPMANVLAKFKQVVPYEYKRIPHVSADELARAAIAEFGQERWDKLFPDGYRDGKIKDIPDPEVQTFVDNLGDQLRTERAKLPKWQRKHYGLVIDDLVTTFPDVVSRNDDGEVTGYSLNNYVGLLHACITELVSRVERLEAK